ncbi:MAG: phosphatidylglycerophosphatase A [Kiritimatiellaceae bacterium]|nr:MAG: phosphatidylglycerophosphatase A [Kiritimatiellaceae bacterium]
MNRVILLFATGFGLGRSAVMPGTIGCLVGVPLSWGLMQLDHVLLQVMVAIFFVLVAVPLCGSAESLIGEKDSQMIVADEFLTLPICVIGFSEPLFLLTGFVFHRIFDITKPPPIRQLQDIGGGVGVVVDDVLAALLALGCNVLLAYWI